VVENAGEGNDTVYASVHYIQGDGNGLANAVIGNAGRNLLDGGAAADVLMGAGSNDTFMFHVGEGGGTPFSISQETAPRREMRCYSSVTVRFGPPARLLCVPGHGFGGRRLPCSGRAA
jgi:hypothetical protein